MSAQFNFLGEDHRLIAESAHTLFIDLAAADEESRQQEKVRLDRTVVAGALTALGLFSSDAPDAAMTSALVQIQIAREAGSACLAYPILEMLIATAATSISGDARALTSMPTARPLSANLPRYDSGQVTGVAQRVPFVQWAQTLVLPAQEHGRVVLLRVPLESVTVVLESRSCVEPDYLLHDVHLEGTPASVIRLPDGDVTRLQLRADLLAAAEMAGACRRMVEMTRDYLLARSQFGQVLGGNQALKHALADAHVRAESLAMAIDYAAASFDADAADCSASIAAAKHYAGRAGKFVAESMLQLHGAIGYTMEYRLHLLIRRVHRLASSYGTRDELVDQLLQHFTGQT